MPSSGNAVGAKKQHSNTPAIGNIKRSFLETSLTAGILWMPDTAPPAPDTIAVLDFEQMHITESGDQQLVGIDEESPGGVFTGSFESGTLSEWNDTPAVSRGGFETGDLSGWSS